MTLNVTLLHPKFVLQASDRRLTALYEDGRTELFDNANKAVVPSTSDAVLTITFTGLGRIGKRYVDDWLTDMLQEAGAAELIAEEALEVIRTQASAWFDSFKLV